MKLRRKISQAFIPVECPRNISVDQAEQLLANYRFVPEEEDYYKNHLNRFLVTLDYLKDFPRDSRVLDLAGCSATYLLLSKFLFNQVYESSFDEKDSLKAEEITTRMHTIETHSNVVKEYEVALFNIEKHRWPYSDNFFDIILAGEVFEHLTLDPMHALVEANRVLRENGTLLITVPNGASHSNILRILRGTQPNTFPVYRPEGANLRHCREPIDAEIAEMLDAAGFRLELVTTKNVRPPAISMRHFLFFSFLDWLMGTRTERKDLLIAMGTKVSAIKNRYPIKHQLYYSWDIERLQNQQTQ